VEPKYLFINIIGFFIYIDCIISFTPTQDLVVPTIVASVSTISVVMIPLSPSLMHSEKPKNLMG
jgi:hypothetical protein